jgi:hypothetical protein
MSLRESGAKGADSSIAWGNAPGFAGLSNSWGDAPGLN